MMLKNKSIETDKNKGYRGESDIGLSSIASKRLGYAAIVVRSMAI